MVVDQATNTGLMFKPTKKMIKELDHPHVAYYQTYHFLTKAITEQKSPSDTNPGWVLFLSSHKRKAILMLPIATAKSYSVSNVKNLLCLMAN